MHVARPAQALDHHQRRARRRHLQIDRRRRHLDQARRRVAHRTLSGAANVAISHSKPERIYALIEAKPGSGLYRSEDAGATWTLINGTGAIITRPFYYDTLGVDPNNSDVVWMGDESWFKCTDGGKSFRRAPAPHGDHHDVWINPKNSDYMIQSNDGGANVSLDGGRTWSTQTISRPRKSIRSRVDNQYPYRVYGAQQDNTTVIVAQPSARRRRRSFASAPAAKPVRSSPISRIPKLVYGSCKGQFSRRNITTTERDALLDRRANRSTATAAKRVDLPLPASLADGSFSARSAHRLLRLAIRASHPRRRRDLDEDLAPT